MVSNLKGNSENNYIKTKKAQRKLKKREQIAQKKNTLPNPVKVRYETSTENDSIIIKGELDETSFKKSTTPCYIRFKLSGQKDFLTFGYQAKIPVTNQFQFEVLQAALLDEDEIAIQLFNDKGQVSEIVTCHYAKKVSTN